MKIIKTVVVIIATILVISLSGCGFAEDVVQDIKEDAEWAKENGALTDGNEPLDIFGSDENESNDTTEITYLKLGETASFSANGETSVDVTVTGGDLTWNDLTEKTCIYFDVMLENTGSKATMVAPSLFSVYVNGYAAKLTSLNLDVLPTLSLDGGRKVTGRVYADTDIDGMAIAEVELQLANTVWSLWGDY